MDRRSILKSVALASVTLMAKKGFSEEVQCTWEFENDKRNVEINEVEGGPTEVIHLQWVEPVSANAGVQLYRDLAQSGEAFLEFHESSHFHRILLSEEQIDQLLMCQEVEVQTEVEHNHWHKLKIRMSELDLPEWPRKIDL